MRQQIWKHINSYQFHVSVHIPQRTVYLSLGAQLSHFPNRWSHQSELSTRASNNPLRITHTHTRAYTQICTHTNHQVGRCISKHKDHKNSHWISRYLHFKSNDFTKWDEPQHLIYIITADVLPDQTAGKQWGPGKPEWMITVKLSFHRWDWGGFIH